MKIFQRGLFREFAGLAGAVFLTLLAIAVTTRLIQLLGDAAGGRIPSDAVFAFLAFSALNVLPVLLSLTLYITVLLTITRCYRDSEMVVWFSSGLSLTAWLRPVLAFALPLVITIAALTLFLLPWVAQIGEQYRVKIASRDDVSRVSPGVFGESSSKDRVFFVESMSQKRDLVQNVFVSAVQHHRLGVIRSERGYTETEPNGDRFLVLEKGRRYEGQPGKAEYRIMEFERYATRIEAKERGRPEVTHKNMPTLALIENPTPVNMGELVWRSGIPISALVVSLLAIPLGYVSPRGGRSLNLLFAILAYMIYANLLSVSEARVTLGKLDFAIGSWLVHGIMLAAVVFLFARRTRLPRG